MISGQCYIELEHFYDQPLRENKQLLDDLSCEYRNTHILDQAEDRLKPSVEQIGEHGFFSQCTQGDEPTKLNPTPDTPKENKEKFLPPKK